MTPLGLPVLPLEKMIVATLSGPRLPGLQALSMIRLGNRKAFAAVKTFCHAWTLRKMSSRKIIRSIGSILAFARNTLELRIKRIPHCSTADDIAAFPAV